MKKVHKLILLGICVIVLSACSENYSVDEISFSWRTYYERSETQQEQMRFGACENDENCKILGSCDLSALNDIPDPKFVDSNENNTGETEFLQKDNTKPHHSLALDPNKIITILIDPDLPTDEAFQLSLISEQYVILDDCLPYETEDDALSINDIECDIWEVKNIYQLDFLNELIDELICNVENTKWIEVDSLSRRGFLEDPIEWVELPENDDKNLRTSFKGEVIFSANGYTCREVTDDQEEFQELIKRYTGNEKYYELEIKDNRCKKVNRKD